MASVPVPSPASTPGVESQGDRTHASHLAQDDHDDSSLSAASSTSSSSSPSFRPLSAVPTATVDQPLNANGQGQPSDAAGGAPAQGERPPGLISKVMQKLGLTPIMLMGMFKGSVAPIIAIAIYQATAVRELLTTIGYLSAIISILALVPLPRGKFLQNLVLNLVATGTGAAMASLALWSSVQARLHTSNLLEMEQYIAEHGSAPYNSSQSAVCAIWLFCNIWAVNTVRAKFPAFNLPAIIYSIFINISCTYGPQFPTFATADAFVKKILFAIFIGLAIATGTSLFVFPISTRQIVVKQMSGILSLSKRVIALEKEYLQGLEKADMFTVEMTETSAGDPGRKGGRGSKKDSGPPLTQEQKTAMALRGVLASLRELMGKTYADLKFAKRDVAFGYLSSKDFGRLYDHIRAFVIPMTGIGVIMDIFQKVGRERGWDGTEGLGEHEQVIGGFIRQAASKDDSRRVWNDIMQQLHEPFEILSEALVQGIDHAGILVHQFPQPKAQKKTAAAKKSDGGVNVDVEESGGELFPGDVGFSQVLQQKIDLFNSRKGEILRIWARDKGLLRNGKLGEWDENAVQQLDRRHNDQIQLFVVLYLEKLMQATGDAIMDFVNFAEDKHRDGSILKKHLVVPTLRQVKKWIASLFKDDDAHAEDSPDLLERGGHVVFVGEGWLHKKDPEHLPPTNALQRLGNSIRKIMRHFGSAESFFGLRVAVATMSVGIVAFLEVSQHFFTEQRLFWALIIIAIGMTQTSGQSIFGFLARIGGTTIAMVNCFIIWYIVDRKLPGILVFLWLFTFVEFYFFFKYPRFLPMTMITIVTQYLIIGYELQVRVLGVAAAAASGQAYYPLYELAPYRLATIAGACLLAFFWTVFPKPLTDGTWLRRDLSATLYLLANYSSVIYTTMNMSMTEDLGSRDVPGSAAHSLFKVRRKLFGKLSLLIPSIQAHTNFQNFEPSLGGKFPTALYQDLIQRCTRLVNYFTLMSYVVGYSPIEVTNESDRAWMRALSEILDKVNPVHTQILSTLTLVSNALMSGQSLPPFISLPQPYELTRTLLRTPICGPKDSTNSSSNYDKNSQPAENGSSIRSPLSSAASGSSTGIIQPSRQPAAQTPSNGDSAGAHTTNTQQDDDEGVEMWHLLDARNMEQTGYTEFAVLQVASTLVLSELHGLVQTTKKLVGTVDFSFRVHHDGLPAESSLENAIERTRTWASRATPAGGEKEKGKRD